MSFFKRESEERFESINLDEDEREEDNSEPDHGGLDREVTSCAHKEEDGDREDGIGTNDTERFLDLCLGRVLILF